MILDVIRWGVAAKGSEPLLLQT